MSTENIKSQEGRGIGFAAVLFSIIGIGAAPIALLSSFSISMCVISIAIGLFGLNKATKANGPKALNVSGIVLGVLGIAVSLLFLGISS